MSAMDKIRPKGFGFKYASYIPQECFPLLNYHVLPTVKLNK